MTTFDQIAARILLSGGSPEQKQAALAAGMREARISMGNECPECGCTVNEWNGHTGRSEEFRCTACDHRFGPGTAC